MERRRARDSCGLPLVAEPESAAHYTARMKSRNPPHSHDDPRYEVHKTDEQWRRELDPMQYEVARHAATERAFTGKYWDHWAPG